MSDNGIQKLSGRPGGGAFPGGEPDYMQALSRGLSGPADDSADRREMRLNRRVAAKQASAGVSRGAEISFASSRLRDPMFYWKNNNLPYDVTKDDELKKIRAWCRLLYLTHPVIASAIDIFTKYPLTGMELQCKDPALTDFYTTLFFDQLDYEEFLMDLGREYWTVGEAWPLGSFNETLGVWDQEELINPDDVEVHRSPFVKEPRFEMRLPESLRRVIQERSPRWEFETLMRSYPELANFVGEQSRMPVSNILLKQMKFKGDTFHPRGIPILMRAFRAIQQEEMLNAAQDATADRLYAPLVTALLGASASDLGTQSPWIPTPADLEDFEEALDAALSADFRVLTHHFALKLDTVFGRENMPNMDADFERLTERILQVFGLSKTMLSGASGGETYAADALNRDLISQLLTSYQRKVIRHYRERALVVAEAQEHYDYEERGGKKYPIMEEILERDPETGEDRIVEQPKLLVPDLHIKAMTMSDEKDLRQFYEALRTSGVPISMQTRMVNVPIKLDEEIDKTAEEQVEQAVKAQEVRRDTYMALKAQRLPIPPDLRADFEPRASNAPEEPAAQPALPGEQVLPTEGTVDPASTEALAPTPEEIAAATAPGGAAPSPVVGTPPVQVLPRNNIMRNRPPESDEMRADMPRAARMVTVEIEGEKREVEAKLGAGPAHIGLRRYANVSKDVPLDPDEEPIPAAV